jgi:hypothetical protein
MRPLLSLVNAWWQILVIRFSGEPGRKTARVSTLLER